MLVYRSKSLKINMEHQAEKPTVAEKPAVVLTGAAKAQVGPPLGAVDIGCSESAYIFRVALPGVLRDACDLNCDIQRDGVVHITGIVTDSTLENDMGHCEMKVEQLCPHEPFAVDFNLPGPVDPRLCKLSFRPDNVLEVIVMKSKMG